jgi:hypothetical protein
MFDSNRLRKQMRISFLLLFLPFSALYSMEKELPIVQSPPTTQSFKWYSKPSIPLRTSCDFVEKLNIEKRTFSAATQLYSLNSVELYEASARVPTLYWLGKQAEPQKKFILLSSDIHNNIFDHVFGEHNKTALQKFYQSSYASASLKLAYTLERAKNFPIEWLSLGDRFSASLELDNLYIKIDTTLHKGGELNLSSYEEYIIRNEMPKRTARLLARVYINCQDSYKGFFFEKSYLTRALEATLASCCLGFPLSVVAIAVLSAVTPLTALDSNGIDHLPGILKSYFAAGIPSAFAAVMIKLARHRAATFPNLKTVGAVSTEKTSQDTIEKFLASITGANRSYLLDLV